jgi:hypothetical protein
MNQKFYSFLFLLFCLFTVSANVNSQSLISGAFSGTREDLLGVRYRNVRPVNASQAQANFTGIPDLGSSRNAPNNSRSDQTLNYNTSGSYTFSITYDPSANTFVCTTTIGASSFTNTLPNVSGRLSADGKTALAGTINYFGLTVRTNNSSSTITVSNLNLDGLPISGSYSRSNDNGESQWHAVYAGLNNGFTVTGTVTMSGTFANSAEGQRIQFFFGYTASSAGSLPVTWGDVTAKRLTANAVQLNWETLQEINASHFDVERSEDGNRFSKIGTVAATGNTQNRSVYSFIDQNAAGTLYYYRLAQYDLDGKKSFSAIVRAGNSNKQTLFATNGNNVRIQFFEKAPKQIRIMNTSGALVKQLATSNMQEDVDVTGLTKGVYVVQVLHASGQTEVFRFIR